MSKLTFPESLIDEIPEIAPLDEHNRTRFTPLVKWLFGKWLAWTP